MEDNEDSGPARASNPRVAQACQRCRSLKTRCLPSEQSGTCQRCFTANRECIWAEVPRRPRRVRGPSRISQVEQKIDGLFASLVNPSASGTTETSPSVPEIRGTSFGFHRLAGRERPIAPGSWLMFPDSFEQETPLPDLHESNGAPAPADDAEAAVADTNHDIEYLDELRTIHNFTARDNNGSLSNAAPHRQPKSEPAIDDQQVKDLLSNGQADILVNSYRAMCVTFPFVPIDDFASAAELHSMKPMLFLAIITAASWDNHKLQRHLDRLYRKELANHTFIRPRRNLSLLQSLLVYLSRYHFVFSHKTQQIFFMQTTANGLALDLALHQKSNASPINFLKRPEAPKLSVSEQLERQRTFLGCYYMSSLVSGGMQRPNLLKYTEYMGQCSRDLRDHQQFPSDKIIGHLITIRRLDDQIQECFFTEETIKLDITDPRILMNFRFLEGQLDEWKREKYDDKFQILLDLSSAFTDIQLHSIALRPSASSYPPVYGADATRLNALLATFEACKRYFDIFLACPVNDYYILAFSEWFHIPNVVVTLARLCIPSDAHVAAQWDVDAAHERGRLDLYLESLCYRMKSLSTYKRTQNFHIDFYWALEMIIESTKTWFMKKINVNKAASNGIPTPDTMQGLTHGLTTNTSGASTAPAMSEAMGCPHAQVDSDFGINCTNGEDPLAMMRDPNFDMDRFFDVGLWGDESYLGMGFGGGT
ncbi:hypothetical protein BU23DRAFT_547965 [Bimuria novae-zelandiae CBS 107.79]|uniref:Zn(2)-C6 fungal-type domain-containing protein n=1 Tax=Bimuria novae-zelandiae CBS 107.79 TaxID=1447943 RepID=A0A6A5UJZ8_9PLEO|nr:hypothetical protein BU23DRAFT_547965 [Bimuria novae-zelandiae CBS 107.79]